MNDSTLTTLTTLMGCIPPRCILLLEDLSTAFTRSTTRDGDSTGAFMDTQPKVKGRGQRNNRSVFLSLCTLQP